MEERKISERESIEIITSMIARTRHRLTKGEGNMLLFWGYLCVIVAIATVVYGYVKYTSGLSLPSIGGYVWWLIPAIGIPYTLIVGHRNSAKREVLTYTDRLSVALWKYVLWLAFAAFVIGLFFFISGFPVWYVMQLFTFFVVGMAVSVQGIIIKERSMIWGGAFSVISGGFLVAALLSGVNWLRAYSVELFVISFIVMMIIPGHILNHKAKKEQ